MVDNNKTLRVYFGGHSSVQRQPFSTALSKRLRELEVEMPDVRFIVEVLTISDLRALKWDISDFFVWFFSGDLHFITNHPVQAVEFFDSRDLEAQLETIRHHRGFPCLEEIECPIFRQDKFVYINACQDICIPTYRIDFPVPEVTVVKKSRVISISKDDLQLSPTIINEIEQFMALHDEGKGYILKLPFCTNCEGIRRCSTIDQILDGIKSRYVNFGHRVGYCLLQVNLANKMEYKIAICPGKSPYITNPARKAKGATAFSKEPHLKLFQFAERALRVLKTRVRGTLDTMLVRVDVMQRLDGSFVVNEYESLEALFCCSKFDSNELETQRFLETFWYNRIAMLIASL
jgi:hypothetical protein